MAVKIDSYPNEAHVIVKPLAYIKMMKHVLLYGNTNIDSSVEVMGICYGKKEGNTLVQYDAIPITHGSNIEVQFDPNDYAAFATADEKMAEEGYFAIGWYHSHPGLKAFFSKVDIKNQLGWQTEHNPDAYGIVFDHTYYESGEEDKSLGFQAFRLDDYKQGMASDYHDITSKISVELPDDTSYYNIISEMIESIQKKESIIKEAKEELGFDGGGVWEVEEEKEEEFTIEKKDEFNEIKESFSSGMNSLSNQLMAPMLEDMNEFMVDIDKSIKKGPTIMVDTLNDMSEAIGAGLSRIKGFFESALEKEIDEVSHSIKQVIKDYSRKGLEIPKKLQGFTSMLSEQLSGVIDEQLNLSLRDFIAKLRKVAMVADNLSQKQSNFDSIINSQEQALKQFPTTVESVSSELSNSIQAMPKKINEMLSKRTDSLKTSIDDAKNLNGELKQIIDELAKVVMSKRK